MAGVVSSGRLGEIASADLAALAAFADRLGEPCGEWAGGEKLGENSFLMPWFDHSPMMTGFIGAACERGLVVPFDWPEWMGQGGDRLVHAPPEAMADYSLEDVQRVVTAILRADRFSEGALASAFEDGRMPALIRRLAALAGA
ncbi:MAG TPA: DUF6508 domain-containing protein [Paracoccus sp. (in: a-proteobacteria)]|nr:DUF6508 domain-containing protein [Paracoccus sp. (in: a-proteobacteria)]